MRTPLTDALNVHIEKSRFGFHMPGHRGKFGQFDMTEVPGLDNLHDATEAIYESQVEIAKACGAATTLMSTNGSTGGILAVLAAVCSAGDTVVVEEGCHRSVFNSLKLAGANAVRVANGKTEEGITLPAKLSDLLEESDKVNAKGVVITRPNYYGVCVDGESLNDFVERLHEKGRFLFVDEAHGAHFAFNESLPTTALECGADCVVQSAHKTLAAMTQSAMIHFSEKGIIKVDAVINKQKQYLTSSPSYVLMQSIESAIADLVEAGKRKYASLKAGLEKFSTRLQEKTRFKCVNLGNFSSYTSENYSFEKDFSRVVINVSAYGFAGYAVANILEKLFGIFIEMADESNLVLICVPGDEMAENGLGYLLESLIRFDVIYSNERELLDGIDEKFVEKVFCKIENDIVGKIAAGDVAVYPPGSPVIFEGEQVAQEKVDYLRDMAEKGAFISGLDSKGKIPVRG